jgi:hypothetical protein
MFSQLRFLGGMPVKCDFHMFYFIVIYLLLEGHLQLYPKK